MKKLLGLVLVLVASTAQALFPYNQFNVAGSIDIEPGAYFWTSSFTAAGSCTNANQTSCPSNECPDGSLGPSCSMPVLSYTGYTDPQVGGIDSEACFLVDFPIAAAPGQETTWMLDLEFNLNRTSNDVDKRVCWAATLGFYTEAVPKTNNGKYLQNTGSNTGISYVTVSCAPPALAAAYDSISCQVGPLTAYDMNTQPAPAACIRTQPDLCLGRHGKLCIHRSVLGCANNAPVPANLEKAHLVFPIQ